MMEPIARRDWPGMLAGFNARIVHLDRDQVVREALEFIGGIGVERASLALFDEGNQRFQLLHVTRGIDTLLEGHFIALSDTVLSLVVRGDQPLYRPDIRAQERRFPVDERLIQAGIVCDFLIPLIIGDTCLGTLNCGADAPDGIPPSVRGLLVLFAPTLAQALLNARLFAASRKSEAEAREAGARYRDFFENAYDAIFLLDERHRYVDVNRRGFELFGYTREEFVGRSVLEFLPPEQIPRSEAAFRELVDKGEYHAFAGRMRAKDGRWLDIEVSSSAILRDGAFVGSRDIVRDVTDRVRAERELAEREAMLRQIMDTSSAGIGIVDMNGRFTHANRRMAELFGCRLEEFLGSDYVDHVQPEERDAARRSMLALLASLVPSVDLDRHYRRQDGGSFWGHLSCRRFLDPQGNSLGLIGVITDITERKRAEQALRQSEERFRLAMRGANDGLWDWDLSTDDVYYSPRWKSMLGYAEDELENRIDTWKRLVHPEDRERTLAAVRELLEGRRDTFEVEFRMRHKDGSFRHILSRAFLADGTAGSHRRLVGTHVDITERTQAEQRLKKSEAQLRESQQVALIGGWSWDLVTDVLDWSDETFLRFDKDPSSFTPTAQYFVERIDPDDRAAVLQAIQESLERDAPYHIEPRITNESGRQWVLEGFGRVERDGAGKAVRFAGTAQDVTARKRAEEAILASESRYRSLFEESPISLWDEDFTDLQRHLDELRDSGVGDFTAYFDAHPQEVLRCAGMIRVEAVNAATLALYEAPDSATLLQGLAHVFTAESYDTFRCIVVALAGGARVYDCEAVNQTLTGRRINVLLRWALLAPDGSGRCRALISIVDISERKRAEEQIRRSEQFIRGVLDSVDEGFIVVDRDFRIVTANKAYCGQVGRAFDEVAGHHCYQVSHRASRPCHERGEECAVRQVFATGKPHAALHRHPDGAGQLLFVETKAYPILDAEGRVASVIETITNITERHLLEEERLKTQKLESIGTLAGGIAHDFNNLLQGVFGYISLAKMTIAQREKSLEMLEQAEQALHLSVNLTSQLLTFSKGGRPAKKRVALAAVVENAAKFALSGSRSDFRLEAQAGLWAVDADAGQIGQVVQNIVLNADQAMAFGGSVSIEARNVPAGAAELPAGLPAGDYVRLLIADTGIGIPERYLARIFDPYFTTKEKGSGLGLATSYSIVRNHGGRIEVRSTVDRGTTFLVYLPASPAAAEHSEAAKPPGAARTGRFLLMDDEDLVRAVSGELLRALGHEVEFAEHGAVALERWRAARDAGKPFDAVILDLTIRGGMGGVETLQGLRELDPSIRAIVSSGYSDDAAAAHHEAHGFRAFLKKPYNLEELRRVLDAVLA